MSLTPTMPALCCLAALATAFGSNVTRADEASPQQGLPVTIETHEQEFDDRVVGLDSASGLSIGEDRVLPWEEVLLLRFGEVRRPLPTTKGVVALNDGSVLRYVELRFDDGEDNITLRLVGQSEIRVSPTSIKTWQLDASSAIDRPADETTADVLLVKSRRGQGITPVQGVVLGLSAEAVRFAIGEAGDSDPIDVAWRRLAGVRFYRPRSETQPKAIVTLVGGSRLATEAVSLDGNRLTWRSPAGSGWAPVDQIAQIDCSPGRVTPVAELRVIESSWKPYYGEAGSIPGYSLNKSLGGEPLSLRTADPEMPGGWPGVYKVKSFNSGVAVKSEGRIQFTLPRGAIRLKGLVGLDPMTTRAGSAEVSIRVGERTLWSGVVDGKTRPAAINAPLDGEPTLTLRVDYGDNLDSGDHVHFANLRVIQ